MSSLPKPRVACLVGSVLAAFLVSGALADRLHLEGGGVIDVDAWWEDDGRLIYQNHGGTVGIPRTIVLKIEKTASESTAPADEATQAPPLPGTFGGSEPRGSSYSIPVQVAQTLERAMRALDGGDYETASSLYREVMDQTDPEFAVPRVGYALCLMALGREALALGVVLDGLALDPSQPALLEVLGDLRNREEQVQEALLNWRQAFELQPNDRLRDKILKAERELHAGRDYAFARGSHFNVRYDAEVDLQLADAVMEYLEEQYWALAEELDHAPSSPITVLLYPTREFRDVTQTAEWVGGIYDGKIRVPLGGLRRLDPRATAVLSHELTHAVIHSKTRGHCPRWLHEGLAQRFEGRRLSRADRRLVADWLRSVEPADWESRGFSYPVALSLTSYLESRRGLHGLVEVLDRLAEGRRIDDAFREVYGSGYAQLCRDWARAELEADEG